MAISNIRFEDWEAEQMQDPEFRAAVEKLEPVYQAELLRLTRLAEARRGKDEGKVAGQGRKYNMSSKDVVSIIKATPSGSRVALTEMLVDRVVVITLSCWNEELYLPENVALILLDVLEDWKSNRESPTDSELIARFMQRERERGQDRWA